VGAVPSSDPSRGWRTEGLTITVVTDPDLPARIRVVGELTGDRVDLLHDCLNTHLRSGGRHAGLDLAGVTSISDDGLAVVLAAHRAYRRLRGTLIVSSVSPDVRRLITATEADRELLIDARADLAPLTDTPIRDVAG
jgi:anti-anti-sigma factor